MKTISLLIPAYNEEQSLPALFKEVAGFIDNPGDQLKSKYDFQVLIVNDGSNDRTLEMLRQQHEADPRFNYVNLSRNFGKENALLAGFDYVQGDCCVVMDADLQHPIEVIPEMISKWEEGYDDVYGSRITRGREPLLRRKFTMAYYNLLQRSVRFDILPNVGDFRLLDRRCINALCALRETQRYTKGMYAWIGFKKTNVDFSTRDSVRAGSSFNFFRLVNLAIEGITSFTTAPLRIASVVGFVVAIVAFLYLVWICAKTLIWGEPVQGFPTIMCAVLLLGGIQLLAIGIIGEYIGRIFNETKNRPAYIVDEFNGDKV